MKPDEIFVLILIVACVAILFAVRRHSKRMEAALEASAEAAPLDADVTLTPPREERPDRKKKSRRR